MPVKLRAGTYAPLYWATSSPSTNTFSSDSSSSARASFRASLTATSFTPLGVAYLLLFAIVGNEAVDCKTDRVGAMKCRECATRREAGRRRREVTMTRAGYLDWRSPKCVETVVTESFFVRAECNERSLQLRRRTLGGNRRR